MNTSPGHRILRVLLLTLVLAPGVITTATAAPLMCTGETTSYADIGSPAALRAANAGSGLPPPPPPPPGPPVEGLEWLVPIINLLLF